LIRFQRVANQLKEETGSTNFDFLINNAGTALYAPFTETTEEQFDAALNIHYKGLFFLMKKHCRLSITAVGSSTSRRDWRVILSPALRLTAR
jgi:NAD(P)-dependent dehydrogenase (short-subunit alcohol dehydrogenase family)